MNYPSVKTIMARLAEPLRKQDKHHPKIAAKIIRLLMQRAIGYKKVDIAFNEINRLLDGHGVEALTDNEWNTYYYGSGVLYVNMGDTYCPTVCYDTRKGRWMVCSWGDLVEGDPKRFADR